MAARGLAARHPLPDPAAPCGCSEPDRRQEGESSAAWLSRIRSQFGTVGHHRRVKSNTKNRTTAERAA